jgi:hypothetical protein
MLLSHQRTFFVYGGGGIGFRFKMSAIFVIFLTKNDQIT